LQDRGGTRLAKATDGIVGILVYLRAEGKPELAGMIEREYENLKRWSENPPSPVPYEYPSIDAWMKAVRSQPRDDHGTPLIALLESIASQLGPLPNKRPSQKDRYTPWLNAPRRTRFVVEDNDRVCLCHNGVMKDLRLKSYSQAHDLLVCANAKKVLSPETIVGTAKRKDGKAKPYEVVRAVNRQLNKKVQSFGFTDIPPDIAFIHKSKGASFYQVTPPVCSAADYKRLTSGSE